MTSFAPTPEKIRIAHRKPDLLTHAEYLCLEDRSEVKHEYINGRRYRVSGSTPLHSQITTNLISLLSYSLFESPHVVYNNDLRVKMERKKGVRLSRYSYPDVSIADDPQEFETIEGLKALLNPIVIVEVLSDSTEADDRGEKFEHYKSISSFREYLLVSQNRPCIERFVRQEDGSWIRELYEGVDSLLKLNALECVLPLGKVYSKVEFPTA